MERFPDGARVVFIGDSLVAANLTLQRIIDHYEKHFPGSGIRFFNCGISGGTAATSLRFFEKNILRHRPTHAVIATGINDSKCSFLERPRSTEKLRLLRSAYEDYKLNLTALTERLLTAGIHVTLCTPAPYDEYGTHDSTPLRGGFALMLGYGAFVRALAAEKKLPLCDYHSALTELLQTDSFYTPDRIHPNEHGYYLIARSFLAHQGLQVGEEEPLPEYLTHWAETVRLLRRIYGAEHMLMKDPSMSVAEKIAFAGQKLAAKDWSNPVFEEFYRCYAENKANEEALYTLADTLYEADILGHYLRKEVRKC